MDGKQECPKVQRITLKVSKESAEDLRRHLLSDLLFDPRRSIGRDDGYVYFPVRVPEGDTDDLVADLERRSEAFVEVLHDDDMTSSRIGVESPLRKVEGLLSGSLPKGSLGRLPDRWEMIGDALVLRLDRGIYEHRRTVCEAYREVLRARYVLLDTGGIRGEMREPDVETVIPPEDGIFDVRHVENGIRYHLDPTRVMFSSGNNHERMRAAELLKLFPLFSDAVNGRASEIVYDMFSGIGYFTLPLARSDPGIRIISCEKNPVSHGYLHRNIMENKMENKVVPVLGDCRTSLPEGIANRILMGYVGGTIGYLNRAASYLSPDGGWIHLHDTVPVEVGIEGLFERASTIINGSRPNSRVSLEEGRRVKSFAPMIDHVALDIRIEGDASRNGKPI
ncbi:MAG: hypothetical protein QCI82_08200 [Candidatus Thermoplasmatota archaeon]|nr:hypothetical protein [Candidatus Thermoplasmatota archaeon]